MLSSLVYDLTSLVIRNDHPRIDGTTEIHPVLRNLIPPFQDLMTDFLPWLFEPGKKIILKDDRVPLYLEWLEYSFSTDNSIPQVICQLQQEGFQNIFKVRYCIYEEGGPKTCYSTQIPIPIVSGYGETDPWGLKKISPRPYTLGGYALTGKGMQKYPISIEQDRYYFGQSKKKTITSDLPQFAFSIDKELIHPIDKGQIPQHFKVVLNLKTFDIDISCNNSHADLKLPEINIIILSAFLTNRTVREVGESLKILDYSGERTEEIHSIIDLIIERADIINSDPNSKSIPEPQTIENLMSQYSIFPTNFNKRKGFMLEVQVRRMLTTLFAKNYYPDRDSLQRKRYLSSGKFFAHIFMTKVIDICNIKNSTKFTDKVKIMKEVERILSSIISTINTDISTGTFDKKTGVWVNDSSTSTINTISKVTACAKKLTKGITKDLDFRYYHSSQNYLLCPYDVPEHGENVGLINSTSVISRLTHIYPREKLKLVFEINKRMVAFSKNVKLGYDFYVLLDDLLIGRLSEDDARRFYYELRNDKREGMFRTKDFGVVLDPYLNELRINIASGRLVQPILVINNGILELSKIPTQEISTYISGNVNLDDFMTKYPHVFEFVDCDSLQVSSQRDGRIIRSVREFDYLSIEDRKKADYCLMSPWGYLGWNINHTGLRNHDEAIRSAFYCSLSKSGIHNKILTRNTFDSYHRSIYTEIPLYTNPVIESTNMGRLAYTELVLAAVIPSMKGLNQEDGTIVNRDSVEAGMLSTIRVSKYNIQVDKAGRLTNTTKVIRHGDQSKIDPVNGLPIINSYLVKGDAMVRNFEQISTISTGVTHRDNSEIYVEHSPARVESVILHPENPSLVSLLLVNYNPLMNGDKICTIAAQKSTAVAVVNRDQLPCTLDGMYPNIIMSPTAVLTRKTMSMLASCGPFTGCMLDYANMINKGTDNIPDRMQIRMASIEENYDWMKLTENTTQSFIEAKKTYDLWKSQDPKNLATSNMVMIHPHTNEILEDIFFAPFHVYRSKHLANPKKNVCEKGRTNQGTGQTTSKRKSGGAPKFDEMSRTAGICYGAAYTLWDLLSDPDDRKQFVHVCSNCGMFANYITNDDESYYVCDVCLNRHGVSSVMRIEQTYAARKFFDYPRARGIQIVLHKSQREQLFSKYKCIQN